MQQQTANINFPEPLQQSAWMYLIGRSTELDERNIGDATRGLNEWPILLSKSKTQDAFEDRHVQIMVPG